MELTLNNAIKENTCAFMLCSTMPAPTKRFTFGIVWLVRMAILNTTSRTVTIAKTLLFSGFHL